MRKDKLAVSKLHTESIPQYLNWLFFEGDYVITKNSLILAFYRIIPHGDYYSPENDERTAEMINRFLMQLPDGLTFWYELQKINPHEPEYPDCLDLYSSEADYQIEKIRLQEFSEENRKYRSERILTIAYAPVITKTGLSDDSIEVLKKLLIDMEGRFASMSITAEKMKSDDICTYLHNCISTNRHSIITPSAATNALSDALWDDDIDTTLVPLKLGNRFISVVTIDDLPDSGTSAEMLSKIAAIDGTLRWVTRFTVKSSEESKKIIDTRRRQYFSKRFSARDIAAHTMFNSSIELMDTGEVSNYQECELAMGDNGNTTVFGYYTGLFVIEADTERELNFITSEIQNILAKFGFIYRSESMNLFSAWLSSIPGSIEANPRKQFISSGNVACLMSFTAPYQGEKHNMLLKEVTGCDSPHAVGLLPNKNLYYLNLNGKSNSGHTFILGPTGSGKSILLSFLAAQWGKYPKSRVIIFDKGASSKHLVKANHGALYYPGTEVDDVCFQPLKNALQHPERCMRFLSAIAGVQNITLTAMDKEEMAEALKLMIPGHESLSIYKDILEGKHHASEMVSALRNYTLGGTFGNLFDAEEDTLTPSKWPDMTMLEMGELMNKGDQAIIPALTYIFGQLDELFEDKRPTLLILDEAWVYMRHPVFKGFIETWLKTLRKYNVFVILATQEVSDYDDVIGSVLTNCHTKILLPNTNALTGPLANLYKGIGLTDTEMQVISSSKVMQSQRDYFVLQEEGNAVVDFAITPEQMSYIRG